MVRVFTILITNYTGSYTLVFVVEGNHTLTVELYDSNDEALTNPEASYTVNFTTEEETQPLDKIDLELTLTADKATLPIWQFVVFTVELENKGGITASNIAVSVPVPTGFAYAEMSSTKGDYTPWNQQWIISELAAGESASIDLTLFTLQDDNAVDFFVQVLGVDEEDVDSSPDNSNNNIPQEDDEALVTVDAFSGSSNRAKEGHWFEVYRNGMTVDLHWLSQLEPIVEEFIIEHWTDGSDYQPLKSRAPQISPSDVTYYTDVHLEPKAGINFYRLKQVLKDGTIIKSPVRQILFEPSVEDFVLFPNPAENYVELQLRPIIGKEVQIMIYDHLGREQYQEYIPEVQVAPHRINLEEFIEGHYMVWIYTKDRRSVAKRLVIGKR